MRIQRNNRTPAIPINVLTRERERDITQNRGDIQIKFTRPNSY